VSAPRTATHYRAAIAGLKRAIRNGERPADDLALTEAQRGLTAARISEFVERELAKAPPLTTEQRDQLAELLRPVRVRARNDNGNA
jgi:hypothetical protein